MGIGNSEMGTNHVSLYKFKVLKKFKIVIILFVFNMCLYQSIIYISLLMLINEYKIEFHQLKEHYKIWKYFLII